MFDQSPGRKREGKEIIRFRDELDNLMNRFFDWDCLLRNICLKKVVDCGQSTSVRAVKK
jgi:hypothetical protein